MSLSLSISLANPPPPSPLLLLQVILTEEGNRHVSEVLRHVYSFLSLALSAGEGEWGRLWQENRALKLIRFNNRQGDMQLCCCCWLLLLLLTAGCFSSPPPPAADCSSVVNPPPPLSLLHRDKSDPGSLCQSASRALHSVPLKDLLLNIYAVPIK